MKKVKALLLSMMLLLCSCSCSHTHSLVFFAKLEPTCTTDGHEPYYECSGCHKLFKDAEGQIEIESIPVINATGHTFTNSLYFDQYGHWNEPLCDCNVSNKVEHHFDADGVCLECDYSQHKPNLTSMEYVERKLQSKAIFKEPDLEHKVDINESEVSIYEEGTYLISNKSVNHISVNHDNVILVFDNVVINYPITVTGSSALTIYLSNNSTNTCKNNLVNFDGDLFIYGSGKLNFQSQESLAAIKANKIFIKDIEINIVNKGNGLYAKQNIYLDSVHTKIATSTTYVENNESNKRTYNLSDSDFVYKKVSETCYARGNYNAYAPIHTAQGLFVEGDEAVYQAEEYYHNTQGIFVKNSILDISAGEDSIFSKFGYIDLVDTKLTSSSISDGLRAKSLLSISQGDIYSRDGYEAIEAGQVQSLSTKMDATTFDDCIEASGNKPGYGHILISGGEVLAHSINDDGLDATGIGYIFSNANVNTFAGGEGEGFDCDVGFIIDSGKVAGYSNHTYTNFFDISKQCIAVINHYPSLWESNKTLYLKRVSTDEDVFSQHIDFQMGNVVLSSDKLINGETYLLLLDSTLICEFDIDSRVTTIEI